MEQSVSKRENRSTQVTLPGERAIEMGNHSTWFREQLKNKDKFGDQFENLSSPQEKVLQAATIISLERERELLNQLNKDFYSFLSGAFQGFRKLLKEPIFYTSKMQSDNDDASVQPNENEKKDRPSFFDKLLKLSNLQNILVVIIAILLGWSGYRELQDRTIQSTISALSDQVKTFEKTDANHKKELAKAIDRGDSLQDELIQAQGAVGSLEADLDRSKVAIQEKDKKIERLEGQLSEIREQAVKTASDLVIEKDRLLQEERVKYEKLSLRFGNLQGESQKYKTLSGFKRQENFRT